MYRVIHYRPSHSWNMLVKTHIFCGSHSVLSWVHRGCVLNMGSTASGERDTAPRGCLVNVPTGTAVNPIFINICVFWKNSWTVSGFWVLFMIMFFIFHIMTHGKEKSTKLRCMSTELSPVYKCQEKTAGKMIIGQLYMHFRWSLHRGENMKIAGASWLFGQRLCRVFGWWWHLLSISTSNKAVKHVGEAALSKE